MPFTTRLGIALRYYVDGYATVLRIQLVYCKVIDEYHEISELEFGNCYALIRLKLVSSER